MAAELVVLPTPPLPEVTVMTWELLGKAGGLLKLLEPQRVAIEAHLHGAPEGCAGQALAHGVEAGDGDELWVEIEREDSRLGVVIGAGHGAAAQRAIDVDVAVGDDFGAGVDGGR